MKRTNDDLIVIQKIKEALVTKSILTRLSLPRQTNCLLGRHMVIPNDLRSYEDIKQDQEYERLKNDEDNVKRVFEVWLPALDPLTRAVIVLKSRRGVYWGDVSEELVRAGLINRHYSVRSLQSIFNDGIKKIVAAFF